MNEAKIASNRRYNESEKGKAARRAYNRSPAATAAMKRWRASAKGQATTLKYNQSDIGKATHRRYHQSQNGKAAIRRHDSRYRQKYPEKIKARNVINHAIAKGSLNRGACSVCDEPDAQAHHPDYSKPEEIVWLCPCHHLEVHLRKRL